MKRKLIVAFFIGIILGMTIPIKEPIAQLQYLLASGDISALDKKLTQRINSIELRISRIEEKLTKEEKIIRK